MKIKLDESHYLNSDRYCYWITCEVTITTGNRKGHKQERRVSGYSSTFGQAVESYIEEKVGGSTARKFKQLKEEINALKEQVKEWGLKDEVETNK